MAYDNLKLEKGLYTTGKSFTQALEQIDPSENYAGTPMEGLDAYQRQLKRFDIKVSGIGSDTVSKFFQTSDSAALFPEYVSRAVRQGMEQADVLQKIVATTTVIDGMDYRAIESVENGERLTAAEVAEGASLPTTTVQVKDTLTEMHKRGRMLVARDGSGISGRHFRGCIFKIRIRALHFRNLPGTFQKHHISTGSKTICHRNVTCIPSCDCTCLIQFRKRFDCLYCLRAVDITGCLCLLFIGNGSTHTPDERAEIPTCQCRLIISPYLLTICIGSC